MGARPEPRAGKPLRLRPFVESSLIPSHPPLPALYCTIPWRNIQPDGSPPSPCPVEAIPLSGSAASTASGQQARAHPGLGSLPWTGEREFGCDAGMPETSHTRTAPRNGAVVATRRSCGARLIRCGETWTRGRKGTWCQASPCLDQAAQTVPEQAEALGPLAVGRGRHLPERGGCAVPAGCPAGGATG